MIAFILETGYSPNQEVATFVDNGKNGVTFLDTSGYGINYILNSCGIKTVFLKAENRDEKKKIMEQLTQLWDKRNKQKKVVIKDNREGK